MSPLSLLPVTDKNIQVYCQFSLSVSLIKTSTEPLCTFWQTLVASYPKEFPPCFLESMALPPLSGSGVTLVPYDLRKGDSDPSPRLVLMGQVILVGGEWALDAVLAHGT